MERCSVANYKEVKLMSCVDAAYIAGLIDGEGTVTLSRKHAADQRQLVISISNTENEILDFVRSAVGAGKITCKRAVKSHHTPSFAYALWNRQALSLLQQVAPYLRSYKRHRARLIIDNYVRLTPRNGKYKPAQRLKRREFEDELLALRATVAGLGRNRENIPAS